MLITVRAFLQSEQSKCNYISIGHLNWSTMKGSQAPFIVWATSLTLPVSRVIVGLKFIGPCREARGPVSSRESEGYAGNSPQEPHLLHIHFTGRQQPPEHFHNRDGNGHPRRLLGRMFCLALLGLWPVAAPTFSVPGRQTLLNPLKHGGICNRMPVSCSHLLLCPRKTLPCVPDSGC